MSENHLPQNADSAVKEPALPPASQPVSLAATENGNVVLMNVAQPKPNVVNGKGDSDVDDEEYEVEYVYEDEEVEFEDDSDPTERQQPTLPLDDENEDEDAVPVSYDEEGEEDEAEFDRIANKIDELLSKTSTLKAETPTLSAAILSSEPESEPIATTPVPAPVIPPLAESPETVPSETVVAKPMQQEQQAKQPPQEGAKPVPLVESIPVKAESPPEEVEDEEEVEYVDEEEEVVIEEVDDNKAAPVPVPAPAAELKTASPSVERSSTLEDGGSLSPPGQLRHVHNKWDISELNDEETMDSPDSDNDESHQVESSVAAAMANLDAIKEEDGESGENSKGASPVPREMPRQLDRFSHQTLGDAMADEEEVNEIEIALEEWKEGDLDEVPEEDEEEEDDSDKVDPVMPDNLLLHANDQIEQIDVPLTPVSPTPSWSGSGSPTTRRPISPSSLILTRVRNLVIAGQLAPLEELLGATPNFFIDAILKAGWTALMYACYRGYPDIVQFCLKRGSDSNYHKEFFTSLMATCSSVNPNEGQLMQCMDLLMEHGARVNAVDKFGCSPLHYAARFGRPALTKSLIEHGANINHSNRNGWTALHWAAAENHGEVVAALLDYNVDVLLETRDGVTAGELAAIRNNRQIAEALHDIEESELKALADGQAELLPAANKAAPIKTATTVATVPLQELPVEAKVEPPPAPKPALPPAPSFERKFSVEEIESRKEEAREIVINAIDAALARDLGKLMTSTAQSEAESGLRKRPVVPDELAENNGNEGASPGSSGQQPSAATADPMMAIVTSLAIAAALFFLFKIMWYFSSS